MINLVAHILGTHVIILQQRQSPLLVARALHVRTPAQRPHHIRDIVVMIEEGEGREAKSQRIVRHGDDADHDGNPSINWSNNFLSCTYEIYSPNYGGNII